MLPIPGLTPPIPWGLLAAAVIAVCVVGSGAYLVHLKGQAAAVEVEAMADVARRNAEAAALSKSLSGIQQQEAAKAAKAGVDREKALQARLRALQSAYDDATENADSDDGVCPVHCVLRWESEGGGGASGAGVPADAS